MEANYTSLYVNVGGRPPRSGARPPPLATPDLLSLQLQSRLAALEVSQRGAGAGLNGGPQGLDRHAKHGARPPRPRGHVPECEEALEGSMSRGVSWWDLPEEQRLARVWPGESEDEGALESPSQPGTPGSDIGSATLRPWTLSYIPPEHLRIGGFAYDGAQSSPSSSAAASRVQSRENTPRSATSRNLFFGADGMPGEGARSERPDAHSPVSFHGFMARQREQNAARSEEVGINLRRSHTRSSLPSADGLSNGGRGNSDGQFSDVSLLPAAYTDAYSTPPPLRSKVAVQREAMAAQLLLTPPSGGPVALSAAQKDAVRRSLNATSFNPAQQPSCPDTPQLQTVVDSAAAGPGHKPPAGLYTPPAAPSRPPRPAARNESCDSIEEAQHLAASACGGCPGIGGGIGSPGSDFSSCGTLYATPLARSQALGTPSRRRSPRSVRRSPGGGALRSPGAHSPGSASQAGTPGTPGRHFQRACQLFGLPSCASTDRKALPASPPSPATPSAPSRGRYQQRVITGTPSTPSSTGSSRSSRDSVLASPQSVLASVLAASPGWQALTAIGSPNALVKRKPRFVCGGLQLC